MMEMRARHRGEEVVKERIEPAEAAVARRNRKEDMTEMCECWLDCVAEKGGYVDVAGEMM